ncbi:hypothetical protein EJ06DRAFT_580904 [Trichodelitschia bisporula]|uniref:PH domain-containing protein n=1 Tax=Trichodelitschia bisporula TaxID=703511 RepID=A0A6G1I0H8_9PEZI|nr:hypothetical protein EJ06DRAFT_580904 [Trichodelitschia bisporula]
MSRRNSQFQPHTPHTPVLPPNLEPDSFTAQRLTHALPEHLFITSRRLFIGPVPKGWTAPAQHHFHLPHHTPTRVATFSADGRVSMQRRVTGLEGPSAAAVWESSFPRPEDLSEEESAVEEEEEAEPGAGNTDTPVRQPRSAEQQRSDTTDTFVSAPEGEENARLAPEPLDPTRLGSINSGSVPLESVSSQGAHLQPVSSTEELIQRTPRAEDGPEGHATGGDAAMSARGGILGGVSRVVTRVGESAERRQKGTGHIKFDVPEPGEGRVERVLSAARMLEGDVKRPFRRVLRRKTVEGQIVKMEKMLVRVEASLDKNLPPDYDENGQGVVTRTLERWSEAMVVCRQSHREEAEFVLQFYKTRVIPAVEGEKTRKRPVREIILSRKHAKVNLYSSLDKTVVIWEPGEKGTKISILRARSAANGVEWYTFLRGVLGYHRTSDIQISIPDLNVSLRIEDPFGELADDEEDDEEVDEEKIIQKTMEREQLVAGNLIRRSLAVLESSQDWAGVMSSWAPDQPIGLAWKRYDRLEWIHGTNEKRMYGTMAMMKSHDLELRPKEHFPTTAPTPSRGELTEPPPVEGFLIRLTSQKGVHQSVSRLFFKRLYFSTHDHLLFFSRPARAAPPPPPPRRPGPLAAHTDDEADAVPLIYAVTPYPLTDGQITWLAPPTPRATVAAHDQAAQAEAARSAYNLTSADGYIDLTQVATVRGLQNPDGTNGEVNERAGSESSSEADMAAPGPEVAADDRTFEIVLGNGQTVRLQAFDSTTCSEWITRLRALARYWTARRAADTALLQSTRRANLTALHIDEAAEADVGQRAKKWEVAASVASPSLYNLCGVGGCRAVVMAGPLYRKKKRRGLFEKVVCVAAAGGLHIFRQRRGAGGQARPEVGWNKVESIPLGECYLYSGVLVEGDLVYRDSASGAVAGSGVPRVWLPEGWTSCDEDLVCCFVVWRARRKGFFREGKEGGGGGLGLGLKRVSALGKQGRGMVFRARSRVERDRWVLALGGEIERGVGGEDVRIEGE